jgi:hypothetical protein
MLNETCISNLYFGFCELKTGPFRGFLLSPPQTNEDSGNGFKAEHKQEPLLCRSVFT